MFRENLVRAVQLWHQLNRPRVLPTAKPEEKTPRKCPSSNPTRGERAFAWRSENGNLSFQPPHLPESSEIETPTRYVGKCFEKRCIYWAGHCQLGAIVTRVAIQNRDEMQQMSDIQNSCSIKDSCRWIHENGPNVCRGCSEVDYIMSQSSVVLKVAND